jgi:hypothetical protein
MKGKARLGDFPKARQVKVKPLHQINVDSFSSSVPSIEGHNHAVVFVEKCTGYIWIYGMKTKDQMINVVMRWYSDIDNLRAKHRLVVVVRDNASENKSQEVKEFFESKGIRNHFSTPREQWQNGPAESTINSIMLIARTVMVESGGRFWFRAAMSGIDARNATFKARICTTPHHLMYGKRWMSPASEHLDAEPGYAFARSAEQKGNLRLILRKQSMWDSQSTQVRGPFMFRKERRS